MLILEDVVISIKLIFKILMGLLKYLKKFSALISNIDRLFLAIPKKMQISILLKNIDEAYCEKSENNFFWGIHFQYITIDIKILCLSLIRDIDIFIHQTVMGLLVYVRHGAWC